MLISAVLIRVRCCHGFAFCAQVSALRELIKKGNRVTTTYCPGLLKHGRWNCCQSKNRSEGCHKTFFFLETVRPPEIRHTIPDRSRVHFGTHLARAPIR